MGEKCFGTNGKLDIDDEFASSEELQPISANTFYNDVTNYGDYNNYVTAYLAHQSYYEDLFIQMTTLWGTKIGATGGRNGARILDISINGFVTLLYPHNDGKLITSSHLIKSKTTD